MSPELARESRDGLTPGDSSSSIGEQAHRAEVVHERVDDLGGARLDVRLAEVLARARHLGELADLGAPPQLALVVAVPEVVLLLVLKAEVRGADVDGLLEHRLVAERLQVLPPLEGEDLVAPPGVDVLDLEHGVGVHERLVRVAEGAPHEHRPRDGSLVGERVGEEPRADVARTKAVIGERDLTTVDDVDELGVDRRTQGVHAGALDRVGVDEARDPAEEREELIVVERALLVPPREEPHGDEVRPHSVRGVTEDEELPEDVVRETILHVDAAPEAGESLQVLEGLPPPQQRVPAAPEVVAEALRRGVAVPLKGALVVHVAGEELVHGCPVLRREDLGARLLELLPAAYELVFPSHVGEELVELALEDVGVRERKPPVVECREDPECRVLALRLDGQQDDVVEDARCEDRDVGRVVEDELLDRLLEVAEVLGVGALPLRVDLAVLEDEEELLLIAVGGDLRVDLETLGVHVTDDGCPPHAASDHVVELDRVGVLHLAEPVVEGTQEQHDGRETLLAVDNLELAVAVLVRDDGAEEVLVGVVVEGAGVAPGDGELAEVVP